MAFKDAQISNLINTSVICAKIEAKGNVGFCKGDSGGALTLTNSNREYVVIGVVSAKFRHDITNPCESIYPGIYTRVNEPEHLNFINCHAFGIGCDRKFFIRFLNYW